MKQQNIVTASVTAKAKVAKEKLKESGINFSFHVEKLIWELHKKYKVTK